MVQCCGPGCGVWQHARCVLPPESLLPPKPQANGAGTGNNSGSWRVPSRVRRSFLCEACRLADADPCWAPAADLAHGSGNQNNWGRTAAAAAGGNGSSGAATTATAKTTATEPPARAGLVCPPVFLRRGPAALQAPQAQFPGAKPGDGPAAAEVRFSLSADAKKALASSAAAMAAAAAASAAAGNSSSSSSPPAAPAGAVELHVSSVLLGDEVPSRCHWPRQAELRVNGLQYAPLYPRAASAKLGAGARDAPASVGRLARPGPGNRVLLASACESPTRSFALVVRLVKRRSQAEIEALVGAAESPQEALSRVRRSMGGGGGGGVGSKRKRRGGGGEDDSDDDDDDDGDGGGKNDKAKKKGGAEGPDSDSDDDDECLVVGTSTVSLRCPLTGARLRDPARLDDSSGGPSSAFELSAFLALGTRTRKWVCPHNPAKPAPLRRVRRDGFLAAVLRSLDSSGKKGDREATEIEVDVATGDWRPAGRGEGEPWRSILSEAGAGAHGGASAPTAVPPPAAAPLQNGGSAAAGTAAGGGGEEILIKAESAEEERQASAAAAAAPAPAAPSRAAAPAVPSPQEEEIIVLSSSDDDDDDNDLSARVAVGGGVAGRAPAVGGVAAGGGRSSFSFAPASRKRTAIPSPPPAAAPQQQRGLHVRLPPRPLQPAPPPPVSAAAASAAAIAATAASAAARLSAAAAARANGGGSGGGPRFAPPPQLFARPQQQQQQQNQQAQRALAELQAASAVPLPPSPQQQPPPQQWPPPPQPQQQQQQQGGGGANNSLIFLAAGNLAPELVARLDAEGLDQWRNAPQ